MTTPAINQQTRAGALAAMSDQEGLDVLVIGGGVTGAGVALDAATRGLRVGIVEAQDWSAGTSSRSSKLVHGGLRYLEMLDFKLVAEALAERELLLHFTAPHLVKPVPFFYPLRKRFFERPFVTAGIGLYDAMASIKAKVRAMPFHRHYTQSGVKRLFPDLREDALIGAVKYWDGKVDDSRLVLTLVRTAVGYGALAASRTQVTELHKSPAGRVEGATLLDLETGERHQIKAKAVINATGVWTEKTQALAGTTGGLKVLASKGIHIVVERERIQGEVGFILQTEKSVLFIIPWKHYWIIGTTDTKYHHDLVNPVPSGADIDYVLERANVVLANPLTKADIIGSFAGLRPLLQPGTLDGDTAKSTKVSREHTVTEAAPGLTVIAGGKLTSYRVMAEDAVDFALGKERAAQLPSLTTTTPLTGATGYQTWCNRKERIAYKYGWDTERVQELLDRYGSDLAALLTAIDENPALGQALEHAPQYLRAEIAFGITHEGALHLEDLLCHRTRLQYEIRDHGLTALPEIADIAAELLNWNSTEKKKEVQAYQQRCAAEERAASAPDEAAAQAERARTTDLKKMEEV